ncbi:MAG: hypothetical protein KDB32_02505 [Planctomycetes bacterium]|nr:hypothetical protein [Planctomycetota bacterium]
MSVDYGTTVASMAFEVSVSDGDNDPSSLTTTVSNSVTTGIVNSEWESAIAAVPYMLMPGSGVFNEAGGQTYLFTLTAFDGYWTNDLVFSIVQSAAPSNSPPSLSLVWSHGPSMYSPIHNGDTVGVDYGTQVSTLLFQLTVDDAEFDDVSVAANISNLGNTGMLATEWEAASTPALYLLTPSSGILNTPAGVVHTFVLTANDGTDQTVFTFYLQQTPQVVVPAPKMVVKSGGPNGALLNNGGLVGFGSVDLSVMPTAPVTIYVANDGTADLHLGVPQISGGDFALSGTLPSVLTPHTGVVLSITFDAQSVGAKTGSISFAHDDTTTATPFVLDLSGTATTSIVNVQEGGGGGGGGCVAQTDGVFWSLLLVAVLAMIFRRRRVGGENPTHDG